MNLPPKRPRFKGIRLPEEYENVLQNEVKQDLRDPEDEDQPMPRNQLKQYGRGPGAYDG